MLFEKEKTLEELCDQFKIEALEFIRKSGETVVNLKKLEEYFKFKSGKLESSWIPKQVRDKLREKGVHLHKKRGTDIVKVIIDE